MKCIGIATVVALCAGPAAAHSTGPETTIPSSYSPSAVAPHDDAASGGLVWKWGPGLSAEDAEGNRFKLGGRIMVDYTFATADAAYPISRGEGVEFRRARLYLAGDLAHGLFFKTQFDFAGQDADFKDVYLGTEIGENNRVQVGHFKQPLSLEELTSSRYITFLERAPALGTGRDTGVLYSGANDDATLTYALGVFQPVDDSGDKVETVGADDYHLTGRVTFLPSWDESGDLIHLGAAVSQRNTAPSFSARPDNHFFGGLDSPADPADDHTIVGIEAAGVWGPLSAQAEVMLASGDDLDFTTAYAYGSYFLTEGDRRRYKRSTGIFDRVKPESPKGGGGHGAVEVALRFDTTDFDDDPAGGTPTTMDNVTLGVNWYLTSHTRIMANAISSSAEAGGADDGAEIFAVRFQTDF